MGKKIEAPILECRKDAVPKQGTASFFALNPGLKRGFFPSAHDLYLSVGSSDLGRSRSREIAQPPGVYPQIAEDLSCYNLID